MTCKSMENGIFRKKDKETNIFSVFFNLSWLFVSYYYFLDVAKCTFVENNQNPKVRSETLFNFYWTIPGWPFKCYELV